MPPTPDPIDIHGEEAHVPDPTDPTGASNLQDLFTLIDQMPAFGTGDSEDPLSDRLEAADGPRLGVDVSGESPDLLISPSAGAPTERVGVERMVEERATGPMDIPTYETRSDIPTSGTDGIGLVYIESEDELDVIGT